MAVYVSRTPQEQSVHQGISPRVSFVLLEGFATLLEGVRRFWIFLRFSVLSPISPMLIFAWFLIESTKILGSGEPLGPPSKHSLQVILGKITWIPGVYGPKPSDLAPPVLTGQELASRYPSNAFSSTTAVECLCSSITYPSSYFSFNRPSSFWSLDTLLGFFSSCVNCVTITGRACQEFEYLIQISYSLTYCLSFFID